MVTLVGKEESGSGRPSFREVELRMNGFGSWGRSVVSHVCRFFREEIWLLFPELPNPQQLRQRLHQY
jgi:hypothetical protein